MSIYFSSNIIRSTSPYRFTRYLILVSKTSNQREKNQSKCSKKKRKKKRQQYKINLKCKRKINLWKRKNKKQRRHKKNGSPHFAHLQVNIDNLFTQNQPVAVGDRDFFKKRILKLNISPTPHHPY